MKRIISLLLSVIMVFSLVPDLKVSAATIYATASFGDGLTWTLYDDGELVIDSKGASIAMPDYNSGNAPWYSHVNKIKHVTFGEGITHIGDKTFSWYTVLESITLPTTLVSIGDYAFIGTSINNIQLWEGLESIGESAFAQCKSLTEINIPNNIYTINNGVFEGCAKLANVNFGENVNEIKSNAFSNCSSLFSVTIPDSVKYLGQGVFSAFFRFFDKN